MLLAVTLSLAVAAGCVGDRVPPLSHTQPSPGALAEAVLDGLARSDRAALDALALTEQEFRDHVWPALPAARPDTNTPFSLVWGDLRRKSRAGLAAALENVGGQRLLIVRAEVTGETTQYGRLLVHRDSQLTVRDESGIEQTLRLYGSVVETADGGFKVFSYAVD